MAGAYSLFADDPAGAAAIATDSDDPDGMEFAYFTAVSTDAGSGVESDYSRARAPARTFPRVPPVPEPRAPPTPRAPNGKVYVMFMVAQRRGVRGAASFRDYLVNDVLPYFSSSEYVHVELVFGGPPSASFLSAMNTRGVIFVDNKKYSPAEYPTVFELEMCPRKYARVLAFAESLAGSPYDAHYFYLYCCIGVLGMGCALAGRTGTYTCAAAVAAVLARIGIGDEHTRCRLCADKNATAQQLLALMDAAYGGELHISTSVRGIRRLDAPPPELVLRDT